MQSRLTEGLRKGEGMQVSSHVSSAYYTSYQKSRNTKYSAEYSLNAGSKQDEPSSTLCFKSGFNYEEHYSAWATQRVNSVNSHNVNVPGDHTSAVSIAECEDEGEVLGITMIPEEGQSITYGMRAMLPDKSTPENPVVQVISNLGGKKEIYNVDISKIDPENATQLEMFALLSYTDKMGITDGGTFGSHQKLEVYAKNASYNGYCDSLSGGDAFLNRKFNWSAIMERMMKDYRDGGIYSQYEDCKKLLDYFGTVSTTSGGQAEEEIDFSRFAPNAPDEVKQAFIEAANETGYDETGKMKEVDYQKLLKEKINELFTKIKKGDTEATFQIGAQSFTEKEWDEFLEKFDSLEEAIRELMREEQAKKAAEQTQKEQAAAMEDTTSILTTEATSCTYPAADPGAGDTRYITWYTEGGIFCRKAGQTEGYEWSVAFDNKEQYDKVMEFIGQFSSDWNMRFAAHENFWKDFLNDEIDMDGFMK